jgi:hypothetical protein
MSLTPNRLLLLIAFALLLAACQGQAGPTVDVAARLAQERAMLPEVTTVEKWQRVALLPVPQVSAPSLVLLVDGNYRMFWNDPSLNGIGSGTSGDGLRFSPDDRARMINAPAGQPDCMTSHPWLIQVPGGYRMYYQGAASPCTTEPVSPTDPGATFRVFSAFSRDGLSFEREPGVRIDAGESVPLASAGHGRVQQLDDGRYRMFLTARYRDETTPAILGATSLDGLNWTLDPQPLLRNASSPTFIQIESALYLYAVYQTDNVIRLESTDGVTFRPTQWVEFYDEQGSRLIEARAPEIFETLDGVVYLYTSTHGADGIAVFTLQG